MMSRSDDGIYYATRAMAAHRMAVAADDPRIASIHDRMAREYAARSRCAFVIPAQFVRLRG